MNPILIIDQDAVYSRYLKEYLELETHFHVEIAQSIEEADMQLIVFQKEISACIIDYDIYNQNSGNYLEGNKCMPVILMRHGNNQESYQSTDPHIVYNKKCIYDSQELRDTLILMYICVYRTKYYSFQKS